MDAPDVPRAYDLISEKCFADRSAALREKKYLDLVLDGLPVGAHVLDFGCGTGRPIGQELIARGYVVTDQPEARGHVAIVARRKRPSGGA